MMFKNSLYHYTSFDSAIKIIASGDLLFSKINNLNDINESTGPEVLFDNTEDLETISNVLKRYCQLSLTMDGRRKGYDIPAMWGHYAQKGKGACIVFDQMVILEEQKRKGFVGAPINYESVKNPNEFLYRPEFFASPEAFIHSSVDTLFFHKSSDWEYEQEYRIICLSADSAFLRISDAVKGVILCEESHDAFVKSASFLALQRIGIAVYRYFPYFGTGQLFDESGASLTKPLFYNLADAKYDEE